MEKVLIAAVFTQVILIICIWYTMGKRRFSGIRKREIDVASFKLMSEDGIEDYYIVAARNFNNLMQLPLLFMLGVLFAFQFEGVNWFTTTLAWVFVLLRCIHSYIHVTHNTVRQRFQTYVVSSATLWIFWLTIFYFMFVSV